MTRRRKQNIKLALVCAILGAIVLMTIFAPWLAPYDPLEVNMELRLLDPCRAHPLGTDALGRDVLSRVIYGGRASLLLAVAATACSMAVGLVIGVAAGYCGGIVDGVITAVSNVFQGLPGMVLMSPWWASWSGAPGASSWPWSSPRGWAFPAWCGGRS